MIIFNIIWTWILNYDGENFGRKNFGGKNFGGKDYGALFFIWFYWSLFRLLKPYVTDDPRGPWELIWHMFLDNVNDDPYTLFVYGEIKLIAILSCVSIGKS